LRSDFADVTVSKIRFLESEGLVEPSRAPSGYRKFSLDDVERLRYILGAQRDQYLPLKVIREHLDAMDRGLVIPKSAAGPRPPKNLSEVEGMPESDAFSNSNAEIAMSRAELIEASGVSSDLLKRLEDFGLVRCEGKWYNSDAFVVAKTVAQMAEFGFEPRHLRAFKSAAEREAGLVEQSVAPLTGRKDPESLVRAGEVARELAALSVQLHAALVRRALPDTLRG
jgi:DNA-binding transcriptional MerR regulator